MDFEGYDFGQPEIKESGGETPVDGEPEKVTRICPCCGEVFEV